MDRLRIVPLDDTVVFPGMSVTLQVDAGADERVLLVPRRDNTYAKAGVVAEVSERLRLPGRGLAVSLTGLHRATLGAQVRPPFIARNIQYSSPAADPRPVT